MAGSPAPESTPESTPKPDVRYEGNGEGWTETFGPPTVWLDAPDADGNIRLKPEYEPQLPVRACTLNGNLCQMQRDNCRDNPLEPCSFTCVSETGEDCTYEGHMISTIPAITNPLNGLKAPMQLLPTIKYKCPAKIVQGMGNWDPTHQWLDSRDSWVHETGSDKMTEGYQEIPYGNCERLQNPPDACYCLFISGSTPENRAMFDSVMSPS